MAFLCEKMYSLKKSLISKTGINPYHGVECRLNTVLVFVCAYFDCGDK